LKILYKYIVIKYSRIILIYIYKMLNIFDIAKNNNYFNVKEPTALKYVIENNKNIPNINKNTKPIITMNDTKQIIVKTNNYKK